MKHFYRIILLQSFIFLFSLNLFAQKNNTTPGRVQSTQEERKQKILPVKKSMPQTPAILRKRKGGISDNGLLPSISSSGTPAQRNCYAVESEQHLKEKSANRLTDKQFEERLLSIQAMATHAEDDRVYQIPTIVHIVHQGEDIGTGSNITQAQVLSQFDVLNEDFRRLGNGYNDNPIGADIKIEFVPVLVDPQGNLLKEPGIDRVFGYDTYYEYNAIEYELKPNTIWDPNRYFNIWVVRFGGGFAGYLGYAQFPSFSGLDGLPEDNSEFTDGVVIGYQYFGRTGNVAAPFDLGRTTTHEVGHWLGLRHIWGDGDCSVDDFCADTPNADGPNVSCTFRDSCPEEGADMIENYMDYSTDGCMNIFTADQKHRMRTVLNVSPRRKSLIACQQATIALQGTNISDQPRSWFEYTATANEVVTFSSVQQTDSDTKLSLYRECNALPIFVNDNTQDTQQSEITISLLAGETIKILWENEFMIEPYNWILSTSAETNGASCALAAVATEGANVVPATSLKTYWFKFSASANQQKAHINTSGKAFEVYGNNCDAPELLTSSNNTATIYDLQAGETIYIAITADGGNFEWSLTEENIRSGEACSQAVAAQEGANSIPYTSPFAYWYEFTMPVDGLISLSADVTEEVAVTLFEDCDGHVFEKFHGTNPSLTKQLKAGQTIKILWQSESTNAGFNWTLTTTPFTNGEICSSAKEVVAGMNHTDATPQWFTYTTTKFTNLKISAVGFSEVDTQLIIKGDCNGPIIAHNDNAIIGADYFQQSEVVLYGINAGEKIYILWSDKWSSEGFDWLIEEVDPIAGDNCSSAKQAVLGTNTVEYLPEHRFFGNIFWTKYTVPASGKTIIAQASVPVDMAIYINENCESFYFVDGDQGKGRAIDLPAGTELVIIWDLEDFQADFTWQLTVRDIARGDLCSNPKAAVKGLNLAPTSPTWYDYVMSEDGSLKLSYQGNTSNVVPYVAILDNCEGNILYQNIFEAFVSGLSKGDHVYIYWTLGYPFTTMTWNLEEQPRKQGDTCEDPIQAVYGLNHADYATQWFTYTAEEAGNLKISSRAFTFNDTDLYVYDGCNGNLIASNNDILSYEDFVLYYQSEVLIENVEIGQTFLIKWAGNYSTQPFDWEIHNDLPRKGDSCEDPIVAVEGVNNAMKPTPSWFTFTMPRTGSLTLSSIAYSETNTNVEVYDACNGNLIASNDDYGDAQSFVHIPELTEGQTVYIRWANGFASELYTFDWRLFVGDPEPGLFCLFPNVAHEGVNVTPEYVSNFYWFTYTMPADNKKLVIKRIDSSLMRYRTIGVTGDCDRFTDYAISEDTVIVNGLQAGQQVLIFFGELKAGTRDSFQWELKLEDLATGDVCNDPVQITPGVQHATGVPTWYQYTIPFNGTINVTSYYLNDDLINTYVEVYDGCDGNLLASNDNPDDYSSFLSNVTIDNLTAGQTVYIMWQTVAPFQVSFDWQLNVEYPGNHAPTLENYTWQIMPNAQDGTLLGTLQAIDEDNDVLSYRIKSGNELNAFSLHETNGEFRIASAANLVGIQAGHIIEVEVTDLKTTTMATITLGLITDTEDGVASMIKYYPNPAKNKIRVEVPKNLKVVSKQLTSMDGNSLMTIDNNAEEIDLTSLPSGVYLLQIQTSNTLYTKKVAIIK